MYWLLEIGRYALSQHQTRTGILIFKVINFTPVILYCTFIVLAD